MDTFGTAELLGDALLDSDEFHTFQEAEIALLNDDRLQSLLVELHTHEERLRASRYRDAAEARTLRERLRELQQHLEADAVYTHFGAAREQFEGYVTRALDQVSYAISGTRRQDVPCGTHTSAPPEREQGRAFDLARRLGAELLETTEYRSFQQAEREFLRDSDVTTLIERLRAAQDRLRSFAYGSREEGERLREEIATLQEAIAARPAYRRYQDARRRFDRLVGAVLDTISVSITGGHRKDAACGSAGSNCGCGLGLDLPNPRRVARAVSVSAS